MERSLQVATNRVKCASPDGTHNVEHSLTLRLDNVSKSFARVENDGITNAVQNIDLEMYQGEFVVLVGSSGCGKSTLLRLIAGLITPTLGTLTVNGRQIDGPDPNHGMVFQQPTLFPWLTVEQNIGFSFRMQGKKGPEYARKAEDILRMIGLEEFRTAFPGQLSGGMAQRVALARSLICEPEILLLDEPLGALDAFTRMNMQDEILSMWKETRQLVVMVTHDVEEAIYMGTKVIAMDSGPGRIRAVIPIEMDYPRNRRDALFVGYRNQILDLLNCGVKE